MTVKDFNINQSYSPAEQLIPTVQKLREERSYGRWLLTQAAPVSWCSSTAKGLFVSQ